MIARQWHGRVPAASIADYPRPMEEIARPDYLLEFETSVRHYQVIGG